MLGCSLSQIGGAGKDEECHEIGAGREALRRLWTPKIHAPVSPAVYNRSMKKPAKVVLSVVFVLAVIASVGLVYLANQLEPDVERGKPVPDVTLTAFDGSALPLASLRGKIVLLEFWTST